MNYLATGFSPDLVIESKNVQVALSFQSPSKAYPDSFNQLTDVPTRDVDLVKKT
jgi:hypothetical protein